MDGFGEIELGKFRREGEAEGDEAFHIAGATAEEEVVLFRHLKRISMPILTVDGHDRAVEVAGLIDHVRGYEDLKLRRIAEYEERLNALT